jgi:DNA-binding MarR family transcriptional regulator
MTQALTSWDALNNWRNITLRMLVEKDIDLSTRQLAILLTVYLTPPPHTVKNLSERLQISKPAVCRAIDTLSQNGLIKRRKDEKDSRVVLVQRTVKGSVYLSELSDIILSVSAKMPDSVSPYPSLEKLSA